MTISWNEAAEREIVPQPTLIIEQPELPFSTGEPSNTFSPGTVYIISNDEYALTLSQDETTVTYFTIRKGNAKTVTHDEFHAMIRPTQGA